MAKKDTEASRVQRDLFEATIGWFHVFKDMIESGDLARMDGSTLKTYLVVKAYTDKNTGKSFPGIDLIAEKVGMSKRQVIRALQELENFGYITIEKVGRSNVYTLREKVVIRDGEGDGPGHVATWDYLPKGVTDTVAELRHVMMTGDFAGAKIVKIENMTVNIVVGDNATQINVAAQELHKLPKDKQRAYRRARGLPEDDEKF